ncbi:GNAT family N-acetyltransferase [Fodinibius salsisoli]|uniref:GNAT family N-acetyltransferase n=1 Tax=Fodinibius salsisoli TaxID=2820877 RepID=A0ABT3PR25_9BACT|nr:GNAT family N-acyltransferase [Fodinibius salsisoli]MCW9708301.1 GNAT family N-acetyltransferase [Fodinibius salsisoli]
MTTEPPIADRSLFVSGKYVIELSQSEEDIRKAQSLRYQVFNIELDEGLDTSHNQQLDIDKYDSQCDHLLVIERETNQVIGTYRMQTYNQAQSYHGFYTAEEFYLDGLPQEILKNGVEVGRACIQQKHRNGRVLYLLWRGIAEYMKRKSCRYLFGCCSLSNTNPQEGWLAMDYLKHNNHLHNDYCLDVKESYICPKVDRDANSWQEVTLPQLFRLYLDLGAKVLSAPALDTEFKTIDFLVLVDIEKLDERTRVLFFK